jgi:hypothetical protein
MQVIWLIEQLDNRRLLARPYWFTVNMCFFAAMSQLMFALGNPNDPTVPDCLKAAEKVREILSVHPHAGFTGLSCEASLTVCLPFFVSSFVRSFLLSSHLDIRLR